MKDIDPARGELEIVDIYSVNYGDCFVEKSHYDDCKQRQTAIDPNKIYMRVQDCSGKNCVKLVDGKGKLLHGKVVELRTKLYYMIRSINE